MNSIQPYKKRNRNKHKSTDADLVKIFWAGPSKALYGEETISPITGRTRKTLQCDRWKKSGIPFRKISVRILYRKEDVISWINSYQLINTTIEYAKRGNKNSKKQI